jgi:hypothetical protein
MDHVFAIRILPISIVIIALYDLSVVESDLRGSVACVVLRSDLHAVEDWKQSPLL